MLPTGSALPARLPGRGLRSPLRQFHSRPCTTAARQGQLRTGDDGRHQKAPRNRSSFRSSAFPFRLRQPMRAGKKPSRTEGWLSPVEGTRLEIERGVKLTVGSNPTPSANFESLKFTSLRWKVGEFGASDTVSFPRRQRRPHSSSQTFERKLSVFQQRGLLSWGCRCYIPSAYGTSPPLSASAFLGLASTPTGLNFPGADRRASSGFGPARRFWVGR